MFFDNMPPELKLVIFGFLPTPKLGNLATVCKNWNVLLNNELLWKTRLKPQAFAKINSTTSAKNIFLKDPKARNQDRYFDIARQQELHFQFQKRIDKQYKNLNENQRCYLKSEKIYKLVCSEEIILDDAIKRSSINFDSLTSEEQKMFKLGFLPDEIKHLDFDQQHGLECGLTIEQVNHSWFTYMHYLAVCHILQVSNLNMDLVYEVIKNLSLEQVSEVFLLNHEQLNAKKMHL